MARVFMGGIATETNSFADVPTVLADFERGGLYRGDATRHPAQHFTAPLHCWRRNASSAGYEVVEGLMAAAQPGGMTTARTWKQLSSELLDNLHAAGPVDLVLLNLHGGMIAENEFDCEGFLLSQARRIAPHAVIACELDPHCHLTELMVRSADVIMTYKHYPHTDIHERAEDVWRLAAATFKGEITPVAARAECHMISVWHTTRAPMDAFVAQMTAAQGQDGILAVSFCHGFALGDVPDLGARMLVYADRESAPAQAVADRMARSLWAMREQTRARWLSVHEALDTVQRNAVPGLMVIADVSDNPGMGAGGDNTELLAELIRRQVRGALVGLLFDPMAVQLCLGLEEGAPLRLRIGGKFSPRSGPPLDLSVRLLRIVRDAQQTSVSGPLMSIGNVVLLQTQEGVLIAINDLRTQLFHPDAFNGLGLDVAACPVIVVKSTQHFHAGFSPLAAQVLYVRNSHAVSFEGPESPYRHRNGDYWPCTEQPSGVRARGTAPGA